MLERFKWNVPGVLAFFGVRKWLKERALHMSERYVEGWCKLLSQATGAEITPERWRQVEEHLVALVYDGVLIEVK